MAIKKQFLHIAMLVLKVDEVLYRHVMDLLKMDKNLERLQAMLDSWEDKTWTTQTSLFRRMIENSITNFYLKR